MKLMLSLIGILLINCHLAFAQQETGTGKVVKTETPDAGKKAKEAVKRPDVKPIATSSWTSPKLKLAGEIDLGSEKAGKYEAKRTIKGGEIVAGGWKVTDKLDMMMLELTESFSADESGAIELDMTNLNFSSQVNGKKQHFFNLYANPSGDQFVMPNTFFTLRGGNYNDKQGNRGIKVLWKGGGERGEKAPFGTRKVWDPNATYTWRAEWTKTELVVFLNDERIFGPAEFTERVKQMPLKYIYLSKDNRPKDKEHLWFGFPGPIYKKIRIYRENVK